MDGIRGGLVKSLTNLPLLCAGAKVACSYEAVVEGMTVFCITGKLSIDGQGHLPHADCIEGWVYVLGDEVRVLCCENPKHEKWADLSFRDCPYCHGLGWTPATDGWEDAILALKWDMTVTTCWPDGPAQPWQYEIWIHPPGDLAQGEDTVIAPSFRQALFAALHAALESMGATFPAVEDASN